MRCHNKPGLPHSGQYTYTHRKILSHPPSGQKHTVPGVQIYSRQIVRVIYPQTHKNVWHWETAGLALLKLPNIVWRWGDVPQLDPPWVTCWFNFFSVREGRAHYWYGSSCSPFSLGFLDDRHERRPIHCAHITQVTRKNLFSLTPGAEFNILLAINLSITLSSDNCSDKLNPVIIGFQHGRVRGSVYKTGDHGEWTV